MRRHFTATGFIVDGSRTLLLWHQRLQMWVPPGGHIDADEDPVTAVLREIREETGLAAEVVPLARTFPFDYPGQIQPPYTILLEDSPEPGQPHKHIDFIYFCRPLDAATLHPPADATVRWVDEAALRSNQPLELAACGPSAGSGQALSVPVVDDVRTLALEAIEVARRYESRNSKLETRQSPHGVANHEFPVSSGEGG